MGARLFAKTFMTFPKNFIWGSATASYQIEGAVNEDGRQSTVWDEFSHWKGKVRHNANADIACDHYHRYEEDVELLSKLGIPNYRFSVAWSRVLSYESDYKGGAVKGTINQKGLDFYNRLIDALLEKGITPYLTMFHWDLPMELERKGGWRNRDIMYWASDYAELLVKTFGDRVSNFFTINEMPCVLGGYCGWMAPGLIVSQKEKLNIVHNILLSHGMMTQAIRSSAKAGTKIGFSHCGYAPFPLTDSPSDIEAFKKAVVLYEESKSPDEKSIMHKGTGIFYGDALTYWCDPIYFGHYPEGAEDAFKNDMPVIKNGDMKIISTPIDFHAQNIYQGPQIAAPQNKEDEAQEFTVVPFADGFPINAAHWPLTPRAMNYFVQYIYERYKTPIIISENGMSGTDAISSDGKCHDPLRIDFIKTYLTELNKAIKNGADVRGYFHWSLLDNFEWARGFEERFGLVHVDYTTQKRTPKDSAEFYKKVIETNGEVI